MLLILWLFRLLLLFLLRLLLLLKVRRRRCSGGLFRRVGSLHDIQGVAKAAGDGLRSARVYPEADVAHEENRHVGIGELAVSAQRRRLLLGKVFEGGAMRDALVGQVERECRLKYLGDKLQQPLLFLQRPAFRIRFFVVVVIAGGGSIGVFHLGVSLLIVVAATTAAAAIIFSRPFFLLSADVVGERLQKLDGLAKYALEERVELFKVGDVVETAGAVTTRPRRHLFLNGVEFHRRQLAAWVTAAAVAGHTESGI